MNKIKLSFCIPTYNRVQSVSKLVTGILSCSDDDIEVVVLDNGSTDDTLNTLQLIKDQRLVVYSNGENKGGLYNVVNVIDKAKGEYLVFTTDKDHVDFNEISKFKLFLIEHRNLASGYCEVNSNSEIEYEIFEQGYQAVSHIAYKGRHPTGYFFNNALLKSIKHVERFSDFKIVDLFPFEFIHAELCLMGNGGIYHGKLITLEGDEMFAKHKSHTTNGRTNEAFFSPEARLKLCINYTKHINTLKLTQKERQLLAIDIFFQQLTAATIVYQWVLRNKYMRAHYHIDCEDLSTKDLFSIGWSFYKKYRVAAIPLLRSGYISQMALEIYIFTSAFVRMTRRAIGFAKKGLINLIKKIFCVHKSSFKR